MSFRNVLIFLTIFSSSLTWSSTKDCNVKYERYTQFSQDSETGFKMRIDAVRACSSSLIRHLEFRDVLVTMIDHYGNKKKIFYDKGIWSEQKKRFIFIDPFTKNHSHCLSKASILTIDLEKKLMKAPEGIYSRLKDSLEDISCRKEV